MRWIQKKAEPHELTNWRLKNQTGVNFNYALMRKDHDVTQAVTRSLLKEQGWLCAYTGLGITEDRCHIEHVNPQRHCSRGEDVDYHNLVTCYPEPNAQIECPYGARRKGNWPAPNERSLFVSPLEASCESRFHFNYNGKVKPTNDTDDPARTTIERLKLDHPELVELRKNAIRGTLQPTNKLLTRDKAMRLLAKYEAPMAGKLPAFQFVLKQALRNHIRTLESAASRKRS